MKLINRWPLPEDLSLPDDTTNDVLNLISEPFGKTEDAQAFWRQSGTALIILDKDDTIRSLESFSEQLIKQVQFAIKYPEHDDCISNGYHLILSINNDEGGGIYLLLPPDFQSQEVLASV